MESIQKKVSTSLVPWFSVSECTRGVGLAQFRSSESLSNADLKEPWKHERLESEKRPKNYLRQEFKDRLSNGQHITYQLQLQLHTWEDTTDNEQLFNSALEWAEEWLDLGTITLHHALQDDVTGKFPRNSVLSLT